ncbi:MAG: reverse transcriptase domain-containing protein [Nanoarchaeota archaeon]
MALSRGNILKTYNNLYGKIISFENLVLAWKRARKGKTKKFYVIKFEENLKENLMQLHTELKNKTYQPKPLVIFILRDPKTRVISKSDFRDRIVHHAVCNIIEPIFDKTFIYDSCANRIGRGNLFALKRFDFFKRKITGNLRKEAFCFKADIKHYFQEVNHEMLVEILERKIMDKEVISLIKQILNNNAQTSSQGDWGIGMPIGNLTSQFFANVYLNELDYFVKHELKAEYYIRYVDDFVILYNSKKQLEKWKEQIDSFLKNKLKLELHPQKSRIIPLSKGVDFVGFRVFYRFKLPRKRNIKKMNNKICEFEKGEIKYANLMASYQSWQAYVKWSNSYSLRRDILKKIAKIKYQKIEQSIPVQLHFLSS